MASVKFQDTVHSQPPPYRLDRGACCCARRDGQYLETIEESEPQGRGSPFIWWGAWSYGKWVVLCFSVFLSYIPSVWSATYIAHCGFWPLRRSFGRVDLWKFGGTFRLAPFVRLLFFGSHTQEPDSQCWDWQERAWWLSHMRLLRLRLHSHVSRSARDGTGTQVD
jgi:hypothetical protein